MRSGGSNPRRKRTRRNPLLLIIPAVLLIAVLGGMVAYENFSQAPSPFPFACLQSEALGFHIHPYIRIVVNGENVPIPAAIGIRNPVYANGVASGGSDSCFEPIHTHDSSGIVHIESGTNTTYTLADFFRVWDATYKTVTIDGVKHPVVFNSTDILGFKADSTHSVVLLVDGKAWSTDGSLPLNTMDFCSNVAATTPPCYPTAGGNPFYGGVPYPYGTGHTIVIEYASSG